MKKWWNKFSTNQKISIVSVIAGTLVSLVVACVSRSEVSIIVNNTSVNNASSNDSNNDARFKSENDLPEVIDQKVDVQFPGGRIFTSRIKTDVATITQVRAMSWSKPHEGPDCWGVVSNNMVFTKKIKELRRLYAHAKYTEAKVCADEAKEMLGDIINESPYTNYVFEQSLLHDMLPMVEILVEDEFSKGNYEDAKKIAKAFIREFSKAPSRLAAMYFASDIMSGSADWVGVCHGIIRTVDGAEQLEDKYSCNNVRWEEGFDVNVKEVNRQLALWGYLYPLVTNEDGDKSFVAKYSTLYGLPDDLPYPRLKRSCIFWGDYYGSRWIGFGKYEDYNVEEMCGRMVKNACRMIRDGYMLIEDCNKD